MKGSLYRPYTTRRDRIELLEHKVKELQKQLGELWERSGGLELSLQIELNNRDTYNREHGMITELNSRIREYKTLLAEKTMEAEQTTKDYLEARARCLQLEQDLAAHVIQWKKASDTYAEDVSGIHRRWQADIARKDKLIRELQEQIGEKKA